MSWGKQTSAHSWNMNSHAIATAAAPSTHSPPAARLTTRPSPLVSLSPLYFVLSWWLPSSGGEGGFAHTSPTVLLQLISAIIIALAAAAASAAGTSAGRSEIWDGMVCGVALRTVSIGFCLLQAGGFDGGSDGDWTDGRMGYVDVKLVSGGPKFILSRDIIAGKPRSRRCPTLRIAARRTVAKMLRSFSRHT